MSAALNLRAGRTSLARPAARERRSEEQAQETITSIQEELTVPQWGVCCSRAYGA